MSRFVVDRFPARENRPSSTNRETASTWCWRRWRWDSRGSSPLWWRRPDRSQANRVGWSWWFRWATLSIALKVGCWASGVLWWAACGNSVRGLWCRRWASAGQTRPAAHPPFADLQLDKERETHLCWQPACRRVVSYRRSREADQIVRQSPISDSDLFWLRQR